MSSTYNDLQYTNYPDKSDTFEYMSDVTSDIYPYVEQYQNFYANGNMSACANLLKAHPEMKNCLMNAEKYNKILDSIKASQRFYLDNIYTYLQNIVVYKGSYNGSTRYTKYNVVLYNGESYMCISDSSIGVLPTNTNKFIKLTMTGEQGVPGLGLSFVGVWESSKTYNNSSAVTYKNCLYASAVNNNRLHTPSPNSNYWNMIFDLSVATNYDNSSSGSSAVTMQDAIDELYASDVVINNTLSAHGNRLNTVENKTYTKSDVGLGNVDNTSDANKSVNYANSCGNADTLDGYHSGSFVLSSASCNRNWNWSGQTGQPEWLWGGNGSDPNNMYVYNPSNFRVNYANSAGSATSATRADRSENANNANYATSAGACDTVDGLHFQVSTNDLVAGSSSLGTNTVCFVYE